MSTNPNTNGPDWLKQGKIEKTSKGSKYKNEENHSRRPEALSFGSGSFDSLKTITQAKASQTWCGEYSHPQKREHFSPAPQLPLPSQSSIFLPSLNEKFGNTKSEFCRKELNSDLVSEESCSRQEFNDFLLSIDGVENTSNSSVSPTSASSISSSSSLTPSLSSPSICCYTISSPSKVFSKQTAHVDPHGISKNKSYKQNYSRPLTDAHPSSQFSSQGEYFEGFKEKYDPALPKIGKIKAAPPPIPPKPSKSRSNCSYTNNCHQTQVLEKSQGKNLLDKLYYNPISFRRKLQKYEKQNTLIGPCKNDEKKASYNDGEHQCDERREFFGCLSVGNHTNLDHGVSEDSCIGSILSVSGSQQDYNTVFPTDTKSNYSNNNTKKNNEQDSIRIIRSELSSSSDLYVNSDHKTTFAKKQLNNNQRTNFYSNQSLISSTTVPPVVIRKLTPKLRNELGYKRDEISSRHYASDNILNTHCNLNRKHRLLSFNHNYDRNNLSKTKNSSYQSSSVSEVTKIGESINECEQDHHQHHIFKSISDTNNVSRSKSFDVHTDFRSYLSNVDIKTAGSLSYVDEDKCTNCHSEHCRRFVNIQCHENNQDHLGNCFYYKIAQYRNNSSSNELYKSSIENSCNSDELLNVRGPLNSNDSSSSSLRSLNLSSTIGRDTIGLKQTPATESFGYVSESHDPEIFCKEFVMEKRRNTLDRWQRLTFGRRSSPTTLRQDRAKKSTEKSERLKELTELLRRNRSSPTPPPVPPPRKSRHAVSASSSVERSDDLHLNSLSSQSDDILLMDQDEDNFVPTSVDKIQSTNSVSRNCEQSNDDVHHRSNKKNLCDTLKPNINLTSFDTLFSKHEISKSPVITKGKEADISTKLPSPESRTVIGSYTRKGIPFRSASFSQIDYSAGKYAGSTSKTITDVQRRVNTIDIVAKNEPILSSSNFETQRERNDYECNLNEDVIYIPLKSTDADSKSKGEKEQVDLSMPQVILEKEILSLGSDILNVDTGQVIESEKNVSTDNDCLREVSNTCVSEHIIKPEPAEAFESNLATLVEEEIPLESPPDNFLQTATTCLIPVPVYECSAQEWNVANLSYEWTNVGLDELFQETDCPNKKNCNNSSLETLPIISVSQHSPTQQGSGEDDSEHRVLLHHSNHKSQKNSIDCIEVKKRYSHDDVEVGIEKRSSLECSLQRICSTSDDRKRIDKSKRRKGMYIESADWVENSSVFDGRKLALDISSANSNVACADQIQESSAEIYLNSPEKEELPASVTLYSSDLNTSESESFKHPTWNDHHRQASLSYQSSEEKDDAALFTQTPVKSQLFSCAESMSDNESDRHFILPTDRSSPSPVLSDHDFKRYSKRPLRGPYGQMLEAEMKKPNRLHFEEPLDELKDSNLSHARHISHGRHDASPRDEHPRHTLQYSNSFRLRKSSTYLPVPTHTRAASTPSQIENVDKNLNLARSNVLEKRYQSDLDNSTRSDKSNYESPKANSIKPLHAKSSSLAPLDKQNKQSIDEIKIKHSNRTVSERSLPTDSNEKGKNITPSPALLAELLQGASEKLVSEQRYEMFVDTRTHIVQEIYRNEQSYVESLQTVVIKYFKVLKMPENAGMIDSRTVDEIFFMVPDILAIHEKFLNELRARLDAWEPQQKVGDAFIETFSKTEVLEVYTSFVNNCSRAKNAIRTTKQARPSFARFLESTAREHKGKLTLDNLLIKPVQKFPNYEMLFTRLIKHTDEDHSDQKHLQEVLKLVHDILVHINCKEREILENGQREATLRELEGIIEGITELIAPDRQFLLFDLVSMPSGQGARKERGFFLFNDLLVITSIKRRSGTIRKPNTASCPGSVASTLDTNKYKFLTKVSLDNLDIIKSKDENLRKIMNEIEQLADDCNKLQQIAEVTATIKYPHQMLEEVIRDLHRDVQKQLSERQSNDAQLNMVELTVNSPNGGQKLSIIFGKAEKRSQWEEIFNEAKQKLAATLERHPIPEFMTSIPIVKTRAGLQFTCAAPTLSEQKDVWVCNSDGYVGQVCVMSLLPEPNVTSCNGVCNARILCLTSVPACSESKRQRSSLSEEKKFRKSSSPNFLVNQDEKKKSNLSPTESDIQLDSNSSSDDSESETNLYKARAPSPSPDRASTSHHHQVQDSNSDESDGNQSTMWLGTEDGYIHVYNCTDTIRIKKNKIKIQHASAVYSILYLDNRVFVSLANGDICVYLRDSVGWNTNSPLCISIGTVSSPVNKLLNVHGRLWCSIQGIIKVLDTKTLQVVSQIQISSDSKPITNMAVCNSYVWISIQNSAHIKCFHSNTHQLVTEVNLAPAVNKMLSNCDDIIRQHKAACLRVTSLLSCKDLIWIGTSAGVLLTIPAQGFEKGSTNIVPTGIPHGHTGHVRFLTFVESHSTKSRCNDETVSDYKNRRSSKHCNSKSETSNILIISGGDGYEDFRNSGANSLSEIAGREDSTNHLLIWQI